MQIRVVAISGSLRAFSSNTNLLRAAAVVAPPHVQVILFDSLGDLPHFNPDMDAIDSPPPPASVQRFRSSVAEAHALLISSPEYAHGVPGVLKNALDWLVSDPRVAGKPIALLNATARATHAVASLRETLTTMATHVLPDVVLPLDGRTLDVAGIVADPTLAAGLHGALDALLAAIADHPHTT